MSALRINRILEDKIIDRVLSTLLINRPVTILRTIARSGKDGCSVPWVYVENNLTGERRSTFISFEAILDSFWIMLETLQLMALTVYQRQGISEVVYQFLQTGDRAYHKNLGWVEVVEKERSDKLGLPFFWIELDDRLEKVEPCFLEIVR